MASDRYLIRDQQGAYFVTCTVMDWLDVFTRPVYKDIITDSLNHCVDQKGLELYAWVLMTNHLHLVGRVNSPVGMSGFLRDFKRHTSKRLVEAIADTPCESRKDYLLNQFAFHAGRTRRADEYKFWQDGNHAISLDDHHFIPVRQKIIYCHENPVRQRIVEVAHHYLHSSALDYAGERGLVKVVLVDL